jgi:hypothetical protein
MQGKVEMHSDLCFPSYLNGKFYFTLYWLSLRVELGVFNIYVKHCSETSWLHCHQKVIESHYTLEYHVQYPKALPDC